MVREELLLTTDPNKKREIIQKQATQEIQDLYAEVDQRLNVTLLCTNPSNFTECKDRIDQQKFDLKDDIRKKQIRILEEAGVQVTQVKCDEYQFICLRVYLLISTLRVSHTMYEVHFSGLE